mmetsp:Transcript_5785/g.11882  ORF Transcript_5785/g.11882 Transcript_5785/m.11882 type:complete len:227 (-) Transcript_5785:1565-2245(-)
MGCRILDLQTSTGQITSLLSSVCHSQTKPCINEDILAATKNASKLVGTHKALHVLAHATLGDTTPTKDLYSHVTHIVSDAGRLIFKKADLASKLGGHISVWHIAHAIGDAFAPCGDRFNTRDHFAKLLAHNRLGNQRLSKGLSLLGPAQALINHSAGAGNDVCTDHPALVHKIVHGEQEAHVLGSNEVFLGYLDILKGNVCSTSRGGVGRLDFLGFKTFAALNEEK